MMNKCLSLLILGGVLFLNMLNAQTLHDQWYHFAPNDRINDMARIDNNLWVHTEDGIVKFDVITKNFSFFDVTDPRLNSNQIHGLSRLSSGDGIVVVTYDFGLISIESTDWKYFNTTNSPLPSYDPVNIAPAPDGSAWVITRTNPSIVRVVSRDTSTWEVYPVPDSLGIDLGVNLTVDSAGNVWVGTETRLLQFNPSVSNPDSGWTDYTPGLDSAGIPLNGVDFVYRDRIGRIWLNTNENIYQYEGNVWAELIQNFGTIDVCEDDQNGIWVTRNNGTVHQLYKYVNDSLEIRNSSNSNLPSDFYSSVYRDWEDWVWMGGNPGKLTWFRNGTWSSSDLRNDVISDRVNLDIETGKNNHIWFLFKDSLQLTNASRVGWTTVNFPAGIGGEKIIPVKNYGGQFFYLFSDYQHRNTVTIHENGQWSVFDTTDAFSSGTELVDLAVDTLDRLWALARNELYLKTSSGWTRFAPDNSNMPSGNYEALVGDKQGNIWIVTEKAEGIFSFDGQNFSNVFTNASPWLITQPKIQMHADDNAIYVYAEEGAFQFKNSQFSSLNLGLNSISDLKSNGDTLIISNDDGLWFWTENDSIVRSLTPSNSLLRFGKPGPFAIDRFNNYWIGNRDETKGALSIYNLFSVFYPDLIESIDHSPSLNWDLQAYPNPSAGEFNISIHLNHSSPLYGKLFDINGRMIWQRKFTFSDQQEFTLDLSDQPTGVYIINLTDGVNQISQKLIKY